MCPNWEASKKTLDTKVKLFLFAPNSEINKKLSKDNPVFHRYFYSTFNAVFITKIFRTDQIEPNAPLHWVFCGPLHVSVVYNEENFKAFRSVEGKSMLTTETVEFTVEDQDSRFFPVEYYDSIVDWGSKLLSSTTRLPSADKDSTCGSLALQATELLLLPKDVSYDEMNDEFGISSEIYKGISKLDVGRYSKILTFVKAKRRKEKILFLAFKAGLSNGGVIAVGLKLNDDGTVSYMNRVQIPPKVSGEDFTTPPLKQNIETLIRELELQIE